MSKKENIVYMVGEDAKRWEFQPGLVILYRDPQPSEIIKYKNSSRYMKKGPDFQTKNAEAQIALADKLFLDVEGLGYRATDGERKVLDKNTKHQEIAHYRVDGMVPKSWLDLVPAHIKTRFVDELIQGMEEEEKN